MRPLSQNVKFLPPRAHRFEREGLKLAFDAGSGTLLVLDEAAWGVLGERLRALSAAERGGQQENRAEREGTEAARAEAVPDEGAARAAREELAALEARGLLLAPLVVPSRPRPILKALCLHVAHACQMRCAYCFAGGGDYGGAGELMPWDTARAAVDFLLGESPGVGRWALDFFGGEPLLNWPVVRDTILYAEGRAQRLGGRIHFTLTTNGLGLTPSRLAFLDEHRVDLVVSVDGRPWVHDAVRRTVSGGPTWRQAVAAARRAAGSRAARCLWIRGTFTRRNLDFARDVLFLHRLGFRHVSLEPVCGGPADLALRIEDAPFLADQYRIVALACAQGLRSGGGLRFYHFELDPAGGPCLSRRLAACGAGGEYLAVTPAGELYACHQLVGQEEFRLGDVRRGITRPEVAERLWQRDVTNLEGCRECWARFLCGGGCRAAAFFEHGRLDRPPTLECQLQKIRWEWALWLAARKAVLRAGG